LISFAERGALGNFGGTGRVAGFSSIGGLGRGKLIAGGDWILEKYAVKVNARKAVTK
jgi:hypothetical protein